MNEKTELLDLLAAEPPAAMLALALRYATSAPDVACNLAALGCAAQAEALDLTARRARDEPAAKAAVTLAEWLAKVPGDKELGIWCLHLATLMTRPDGDVAQVEIAADWLHRWFSDGSTRRPVFG